MSLKSGKILNLVERLKSPQPWVRLRAAIVLASCGRDAESAVDALTDALNDDSVHVRQTAAFALGAIGAEARLAAAPLLRTLLDENASVRRQAALALGQLAGETALPALRNAMCDCDESVQRAARQAVEKILPGTCRKPAA